MSELTKLRLMYVLSPLFLVGIVTLGAILDISDQIAVKLRKDKK